MIIRVAVPTPVENFFDYLPPESTEKLPVIGARVKVPFGPRKLIGIIIDLRDDSDYNTDKLKPIIEVLDTEAVIPADMIKFIQRAARYYHYPLGEALSTALPNALRAGVPSNGTDLTLWRPSHSCSEQAIKELNRAKAQEQCLNLIKQFPEGISEKGLREHHKGWRKLIAALQDKELIEPVKEFSTPDGAPPALQTGHTLNEEQRHAIDAVNNKPSSFHVALLEGITGSGKTEVYLSMMEPVIAAGKQVLILVPEIGLTPQLQARLQQRFQTTSHCIHSGLNKTERLRAWRVASQGRAPIILGTRSALFTPLPKLGMIIVDEEHDGSFKQQEGFRYHARDLAVMRGQINDIPVILGTATPSLESLYHAQQGHYQHLKLTQRAGGATPPSFRVVDLRRQHIEEGLSLTLQEHMTRHLEAGNQILLFINRRGFSPVLLCHDCGTTLQCPHCDTNSTYHAASHSLRCHHCGYVARVPTACPHCKSKSLVNVGVGTERLEEALKESYPNYSTIRIDRDTMTKKGQLEATLEDIREGKHQIILGTQMLAKGHDFPTITLVGIVDVDQGLFSAELRAQERLAQQILQVGGRAGRGSLEGEVVLQTHQPDHPALQSLLQGGYTNFANNLLKEREVALFPPYGYLTLIRSSALQASHASDFLKEVAELTQPMQSANLMVLGPVPSSMEKRAGRYHHQLLIMSPERAPMHKLLNYLHPKAKKLKTARKVRWSIDVDPMESV